MKVFLVFMALVIMNVNTMIFHDDLRAYRQICDQVETAAENSASGAAMYFDLEKYADGYLVYDVEEARSLIKSQAERLEEMYEGLSASVHYRAVFYNEDGSGIMIQDGSNAETFDFAFPVQGQETAVDGEGLIREPSVSVYFELEIDDVFRQPFLKADKADGGSVYSNGHIHV